jgi:hypothetical protein
MAKYENVGNWGRETAQKRYGKADGGPTLQDQSTFERVVKAPKTTNMPPKGPSDSYVPPSPQDRGKMGEMAKASGGAAHPGFKAVQSKIEGEGYSKDAAGAILASKTRNASKAAHKANPRLNKVKG